MTLLFYLLNINRYKRLYPQFKIRMWITIVYFDDGILSKKTESMREG